MEGLLKSSICSLAYGSLAQGGATVDSYLMALCRPHYKPPSALVPVGTYTLPLPEGSSRFRREVHDIQFSSHDPSLLLACTSDDVILAFDMNAGAFLSETRLSVGRGTRNGQPKSIRDVSCIHVNRNPRAPLVFAGTADGEVLLFDTRISSLNAKFSTGSVSPALRLAAAHDGAICGIRTGLALHPHLFLTGGRDDRWLRLFDLRFPFHYASAGSSSQRHAPFPLEATRLGPSVNEGGCRTSLMAFDVSPDGSLLAASVARCRTVGPSAEGRLVQEADGETIVLSLRDSMRALKTIASADACTAEFIQFSPNGKYLLQTGSVRAAHCKQCWRCACGCSCESRERQDGQGASVQGHCCKSTRDEGKTSLAEYTSGEKLPLHSVPLENGLLSHNRSSFVRSCTYHRAQLVNLIQSNRTINLKSPAEGAVAFVDSFCLSHSPRPSQLSRAAAARFASFADRHAVPGSCGALLDSHAAGTCGLLPFLDFTLHGPRSRHVQISRRRLWDYLSGLQEPSTTVPDEARRATWGEVSQRTDCSLQLMRSRGIRKEDSILFPRGASRKLPSREKERDGEGLATNAGKRRSSKGVEAAANNTIADSGCLLFPLLHPQLSQFVAACGPLHPAFVRAEAATFPFTCRLWGGLVVGFGGSTANKYGSRRLYDGVKLWDSTTGVVLSWTEGYLASEDNLRCLAPVPDVSTGLLATGGALPFTVSNTLPSSLQEGLTFWSVRRRDDLLMLALDGSLSLQVNLQDDDTNEVSVGDYDVPA